MKRTAFVVLSILLAPPLFGDVGQHLIPAGTLVTCNTGDARISSRNTAIGDPVLCKVARRFGTTILPYGSVLGGTFSDFRDPGHFVGKGFMQLEFDRMYIGDQVIPIDAKVVDVPGYRIDPQGRIIGKGHAVRDTITWMIPVLWPIDLINLPRRGPRPTLKAETSLTLRVMDDIQVPETAEPERDPYGLIPRGGQSYAPQPDPPAPDPQPQPQMSYAPPPPPPPQPQYQYQYAPPPQVVVVPTIIAAPPVVVAAPMFVAVPMVVAQPMMMGPPVVAYGAYAPAPAMGAPGYAGMGASYRYGGGYAPVRATSGYRYGYTGPRTSTRAWGYGGAGFARAGMAYRGMYNGR